MSIISEISHTVDIPERILSAAIEESRKAVKHIKIPKKDGSLRTVYQPTRILKIVQYWLIENVFRNIRVHKAAAAFVKGKSVKNNVDFHKRKKYFLILDFKDFFPSIRFVDLEPTIHRHLRLNKKNYDLDELLNLIRASCFYLRDSLPIGYPSSPIISNIVMFNFDDNVSSTIKQQKGEIGSVSYSRYADDLTFGTNKKGACKQILTTVKGIIKEMDSPKLMLNNSKTRFLSASGGSAIVTGLKICHDNHVTIHKHYKDKIRLMLALYSKGKLDDDVSSLLGHLAYIRHVDGTFYTKLCTKYFDAIKKLNIS